MFTPSSFLAYMLTKQQTQEVETRFIIAKNDTGGQMR